MKIVGYTLGDQAGIGPELVQAVLGGGVLPQDVEYRLIGNPVDCVPGRPTMQTARAAFEHLELAAQALRVGEVDAVVTAPVSKELLHACGFNWPGQTEFFAERLGVRDFAMCLSGEHLTIGLCTIHVPLADVSSMLTQAETVRVAKLLANFCHKLGYERPRVALAGVNPHAGENGAFGTEELQIIAPAVAELNSLGLAAEFIGPCVPDAVYRHAAEGSYTAVLVPYHDQGLIPLKMLDFNTAVNITLGLPRPRLSPDHGTAFALAGKGLANPSSMLHAFRLAVKLVND